MNYKKFEQILEEKDKHIHILNSVYKDKLNLKEVIDSLKKFKISYACEHSHDFNLAGISFYEFHKTVKQELGIIASVEFNFPFKEVDRSLIDENHHLLSDTEYIILSNHRRYYDMNKKKVSLKSAQILADYIKTNCALRILKKYDNFKKDIILGHPLASIFDALDGKSRKNLEMMLSEFSTAIKDSAKRFKLKLELNLNYLRIFGDDYAKALFNLIKDCEDSLSLGSDIHLFGNLDQQRKLLWYNLNEKLSKKNKDILFSYLDSF